MTKDKVGYFGLVPDSEAEATAVAEQVSRGSDAVWVVVELTYADGRVTYTTETATAFARSSVDGQGQPRTDIRFRAVRKYHNGQVVA